MADINAQRILQSIWPEWSIAEVLGSGTYGDVYRITRDIRSLSGTTTVSSESALKIISIPREPAEIDSLGENPEVIMQSKNEYAGIASDFSNEIRLLESLKGAAGIVHIEDYRIQKNEDDIGWTIVIRMELLSPIRELYPFSEENAIRLGIDICTALEVCAKKNILHRDIKPSNIFCTEFGNYKLGDFGISKLLQSADSSMTQGIGTPNYVAPEVVNGGYYDYSADLYSLGMVLYTLLNGQRQPFCSLEKQILSYQERVDAHLRRMRGEQLPPPANASPALSEIILKACSFKPEDRFSSAAEMKKALLRLTDGTQRAMPAIRSTKRISPMAASVAVLSAMVIGLSAYIVYDKLNEDDREVFLPVDTDGEPVLAETEENQPDTGIVSLQVTSYPTRTAYTEGDRLELDGLVLTAAYRDGSVMQISGGFTCAVTQLSGSGRQKIAVSFEGMTADIYVTVNSLYQYELNSDGKSYKMARVVDLEAEKLVIPEVYNGLPVTVIGTRAFAGSLAKEIILPESIVTLEAHAFYCASCLESIRIPAGVTDISSLYEGELWGSIFAVCDALKSVEVDPANPKYHSAGNCVIDTAAKILVAGCNTSKIPDDGSVETIGTLAFQEMYYMDKLVIPEGVKTVQMLAFETCSFKEISIAKTVTEIELEAVRKPIGLERIAVAEGNPVYHSAGNCLIKTDEKVLIFACPSSEIPTDGSVETIDGFAYCQSEAIDRLVIPEGIKEIRSEAFAYTSLRELILPASLERIHPLALMSCDYIRTIAVAEENPIYHSAGNCLIETKTKTLVIGCQTSVIPDDGSVTRIGDLAFYEGPITRLILPEGITELGHDALAFTQLSAIHIPSTLSEIAVTAFDGCRQLDTITVSPDHPRFIAEGSCLIDTTSDVLVIGGNAAEIPQDGSVRALNGHSFFGRNIPHAELPEALVFLGDSSFVDSTLESVYIPGKINAILAFTFSGCRQLERVYIPRAVKTIDANAFHSCTSLKNIYYAGSEEEWNRIVVGENNAYLLNGEIHFNQTKSDYEAGIAK